MRPHWWDELAAIADKDADRFSAAWYERFRLLHAERFPDADQRTRENLLMLVESARLRETGGGPFAHVEEERAQVMPTLFDVTDGAA